MQKNTGAAKYNLLRRDSYLEGGISGSSTVLQAGNTTNLYDVNNNLIGVRDATKSTNNRDFVTDAAGRILQASQGGNVQRQLVVKARCWGATAPTSTRTSPPTAAATRSS